MAHWLAPLLAPSSMSHFITTDAGAIVARHVETAFDSEGRKRGLIGRDQIAADAAMVIAPCSAIHTWRMRFPIDVVFTDREGRVLKVSPGLPSRRIAAHWGAFAVVELTAGRASKRGIVEGARLVIVGLSSGADQISRPVPPARAFEFRIF